jgi:tetratricopeptide (TPR) repeat protein
MKFIILAKEPVISIFVIFLFASCAKADTETIRLYAFAEAAYSQGRFFDVIEILHKENNFPPSLILRTKAEYFFGDLEAAEKTCRRAIKLRPSSIEANLYLARILRDTGDITGVQAAVESL